MMTLADPSDAFDRRAHASYRQAADALSPAMQGRLRAARRTALAGATARPASSRRLAWQALPVAAVAMALFAVAIGLRWQPGGNDGSIPASPQVAQATADPALPAWEQLSPAQRDQLIGPLRERWNTQPHVRSRLLRNAQRWQELSPEQRERAQRGLKRLEEMTPEQRKQAISNYQRMRQQQQEDGDQQRKQPERRQERRRQRLRD